MRGNFALFPLLISKQTKKKISRDLEDLDTEN